jgi:L-cysteine:1D-myo-inositol 2-amino-2-deoxy-alpha-D-glucopyranoside ligase
MEALKVLPPDAYVGVVESVDLVAAMVVQLREEGHAYLVDEDWYFDVHSDPDFGSVSGLDVPTMLRLSAERGGVPDRPGKRDPLDCLLWRAERPGEPAWDSPLGRGRPGWHVECSAIALANLGLELDVQGGGSDLVFPHHEMSASQVQAADPGARFARSYLHTGMVGYRGEKMSKSLGNLVFVNRLRHRGTDPDVLRLALLSHHYREDWEWTDRDLAVAERRLERWRDALPITSEEQAEQLVVTVRGALAVDLDTPRALRLLDDWALGWHPGDGAGADVVRDLVEARLGLTL